MSNPPRNFFLNYVNAPEQRGSFSEYKNRLRGDWVMMNPDEAAALLDAYADKLIEKLSEAQKLLYEAQFNVGDKQLAEEIKVFVEKNHQGHL